LAIRSFWRASTSALDEVDLTDFALLALAGLAEDASGFLGSS